MTRKTYRNLLIATTFLCPFLPEAVTAADYWWDSNTTTAGFGNTTGIWGANDFWSISSEGTATPTAAVTNSLDTVNFGTAALNYANGTVGIAAGGVTVNSIIYGAGQTTAINLGTAGNTLTLDGTAPTITVNHASAIQTISSPIAGSTGLTKAGVGILALSGSNTYMGVTSINGGTLTVGTLANAGANSGIGSFATAGATGLILSGGTFNYTGASTTTDRGFTVNGSTKSTISVGTEVALALGVSLKNETVNSANGLTFSAAGSGSSITISSLTIIAGKNPDFNLTGGSNPNVTIQNLNVSGSNVIHERTGTYLLNVGNINGTGASGWLGNMNITGVISGYTGSIFLGGNTTLTGLSTFNTTITAQQGSIYSFNSIKNVGEGASALGAPTTPANGTIGFGNGSSNPTLRYIGSGDTTNRVLDLRGTATLNLEQAGTGNLHFTGNTSAAASSKTLNLTGSTAGTGQFTGVIADNSSTNKTSLSKSGTGTWTLSGTNTYTGTTTINGGTLALGANNALPNTSAVSIGTATLDAATFTDTAGTADTLAVTGAATIKLGSGAVLAFANSSAVAWPGTLNIIGNLATASISFGGSASGLIAAQFDKITVNGSGLGDYALNSSGILILDAGPPDTLPPTPSPMIWASVPAAASSSSITMTATTATDVSSVEYFFDETSNNLGGTDSNWQNSPTYTDAGLSPGTTYTYTVTARDKSAGQNSTTASASASATTTAAPLTTVWNLQVASQSVNQITTADNFIGAAAENTANSTWNRVATLPQNGFFLKDSTGSTTAGVSVDLISPESGSIGTQNLNSGDKIFNSRVGGGVSINMSLKGVSITNSYDIVFYSDWWWGGDPYPITQTVGTGSSGTIFINRIPHVNGTVPALTRDTNPADVASGAGNTGNWYRINGLLPNLTGEIGFRLGDGENAPFNGFQLVATPRTPRADILSMNLPGNPGAINGTNITFTVPFATDVTNLAPTFTLYPGATCPIASGTPRNFTSPQTYTVTSSNGLVIQNYIVTVVVAPPLPEFTLTAPASWDGRSSITVQPVISNLALLQSNGGTNFTYQWSTAQIATTYQITPGVMTLTRAQGSGSLVVTLTMANGTTGVTRSTTINVQEPASDPWVERTPLTNEKPVNNQFFARNPFTNLGTLFYRGTQAGSPNSVFLKVYKTPSGGSESLDVTYSQLLTGGTYNFSVPIQAGLITYRVVYGTTTGGVDTDLATVTNLVCGDAYIIEGQSNAVATDNSALRDDTTNPWIRTYGTGGTTWTLAQSKPTDPSWPWRIGFWGMRLAQNLVTNHQMPVCIINGAVGGTRIDQHQPNPIDRTQAGSLYSIYANLLNRVSAARLNHGIRGIFWHQGESDCSNFGPVLDFDYTAYEQNFLSMSSAWKQDYPNFQRYVIFQVMPRPCSIGPRGDELREVQRTLPRLFSKMSILNTLGIVGYEGCHFSEAGYINMASRITPVVSRDFYGITPSAAVTAPNLMRASFTSAARSAIALEFDQPVSWSSFSLPNYYINEISNQVTSGSASGNIVTLQLASAAPVISTIDYLKDSIWNQGESVSSLLFGANNIPVLTFANVPVQAFAAPSDYSTWATIYAPANLTNASGDLDDDGMTNEQERAFGLNPTMGTSVNPISLPFNRTNGTFSYTRRNPTLTNLTYTVWTSTTMGTWTQDPTAVQTPSVADGNGIQTVAVTITPALLSNPALFVRVTARP